MSAIAHECWLRALLAMLTQARQHPALVAPHQAGVADNVGGQDRRQFALFSANVCIGESRMTASAVATTNRVRHRRTRDTHTCLGFGR